MKLGVPRVLIVGTGALFSAYHLVLAFHSLTRGYAASALPIFVAMGLYSVATALSLVRTGRMRMPHWLAALNVAVVIALPLLVTSQLDPQRQGGNGYATWYVAAVGTLMTITSTRRRHSYAWVGISTLVVQTVLWAGPGALGAIGVVGSVVWVAVSHILSSGLSRAAQDASKFALAEREAAEWQAAQEAHLYERQFRLAQTSRTALPMLQRIAEAGGELSESERAECRHLEAAIRDEIRGRLLLNDAVRREVMAARQRGATVTLLDEGGLDGMPAAELDRVLSTLADALSKTDADRIIVRSVPDAADVAVTVVGIKVSDDGSALALGLDHEDEVALWLEIPRPVLTT
ncbi:hypothetical protein [Ruicaihuangia caeni]|uniref:hypothetical protein n=1 Tax=Ruicaihuangia caeni TaxID=3042517 RepID=UPI00338E5E1E